MRKCKCSGREVLEPHKLGLVCERGCMFFRGEGRFLHSMGHVKNMFYATSFFTSLLRTYLRIKRCVGLPRMEVKIWWWKQTVKIPELFSSSFHFVFAARIKRNDVALLINTAPSTVSQSANASDCYSLRVRFKSWLGHRVSWIIFVL